jgi:cation diffusion facilitator family transporter
MRESTATRAAWVAIIANLLLLGLKASATNLSDSLTIFSETLNSLADVVAAFVILLCVRLALKSADEDHPFGHRRAEPIAGLIVAIFTGILGFEVCKQAVFDLMSGELPQRIGPSPIIALCITAGLKAGLFLYFQRHARQLHSPALRAAAIDCRNDVFIATQGLIAVVLAELQVPMLDTVSALIIGAYILYSGHHIGMENLDYLMGHAPDEKLLRQIRELAQRVPGVRNVGEVKGHYVGTFVHVELTAVVDGTLTTSKSHDVCEATRAAVEAIPVVDRAFVHMSPTEQNAAPVADADHAGLDHSRTVQ